MKRKLLTVSPDFLKPLNGVYFGSSNMHILRFEFGW